MNTFVNFMKYQDRRILYLLNRSMKFRVMDVLMRIVTQLGSLPVIILLAFVCLFSSSPTLANAGRCLAVVLLCSQLIVHLLKWFTSRPRPSIDLENIICGRTSAPGFSFPSGHSCAAFAVAITLSPYLPAAASLLICLAMLVGISRICLGTHYPSDVLVGFIIAFGVHWIYI